ncbi:MAG TPA: extracellular solute-binding protein [Bauldia sp.]|nr:extracellular solute-binding protein [Bauldia sp.]
MTRYASWRRALGIAVAGAGMMMASAAFAATTITVWCWDTNFNGAAMREAGARYTKAHPDVTLNIVDSMSQDDIRAKLQAQLLANSTEGLPDIVLIQDDVAQKYLQAFPGAFEPLSDSIDESKFAAYKVKAATYNGKSYSLPFDSGVTGLFYRSDYLAQAGYKADDLKDIDWDQLIKIGQDVKAKTGHDFLDLDTNDDGVIRMMMQSVGQWYFTPDGKLDILDNAPLKAALTEYGKIWQAGIVKPVSGWSDYTGAFTSGEVAAVPVGVWITGTIKANADQAGKWGVAPLPKLAGFPNAVHASNQGGSSWYVLSSSANKPAAIDFLKTIWGSDVDFYQKILIGQGAFATYLPARDGDAYKASDPFFGGQPVWQDFSDWVAAIPGVDYGVYTAEVDSAVQAQLPNIIKGGSVDDALQAINDQAQGQIQ